MAIFQLSVSIRSHISVMQVALLPVLREQPFFHHASSFVMPSRIATGPTRCMIERCEHFAKVKGMCLTHSRNTSVACHHSPSPAPSSASSSPRTSPSDAKLKLKNRNRKCRTEACLSYARSGGYCTRHGGGRKCKVDSCGTASQTGGYCRLHGGGSRCRVSNCQQFARIRGLCLHHNRGGVPDATASPRDFQ
ncbi:unnamed protein product [Aphanomyces euteiches]